MKLLNLPLKRLCFLLISASILLSSAGIINAQSTPAEERAALMEIYTATDGPNWRTNTNWGVGDPFTNQWFGVTFNSEGHVTGLNFLQNNLRGSIPSEIKDLTHLTYFNSHYNYISSLPAEIGTLSNLTFLRIAYYGNNPGPVSIPNTIYNLTGLTMLGLEGVGITEIPAEIGNLQNLETLQVYQNQISELPDALFTLSKLSKLHLSWNKLTELPPGIGDLSEMRHLILNYNQLTSLPPEIGKLTKMYFLTVFQNEITGLPDEFADLTNLQRFQADFNQIASLPPGLFDLPMLWELHLSNNNLSGNIPPELGAQTSLKSVNLNDNNLEGEIPPELAGLYNLTSLNLRNNNLSGCFDQALTALCGKNVQLSGNPGLPDFNAFCTDGTGECGSTPPEERAALMAIFNATDGPNWRTNTSWGEGDPYTNQWFGVTFNSEGNVTGLNFPQNNLRGSIPPEIKDLTHLTSFDSHYNYISALPPEIGTLSNLTLLRIAYNGPNPGYVSIPDEIYNLTGLTTLGLEGVGVTDIPPEIGNLQNLTTLYIFQNQISELPDELFTLSKLSKLHLSWNLLTELPPGIGDLSEMRHLILNYNQLTSLPPEIGKLTKMYFLTVFQNEITGLPDEFADLTNLQRFQADFNQIASLPPGLFDLPMLWELHLSNNNLSGNIPPELGAQTSLKSVYLNDNQLEGKIPPELAALYNLTSLNLSNNNLSGCFDPALTALCGKNVQLSGNPGLPDFSAFCADGTGTCVPPVAVCTDITVYAGDDCTADASIDGGSYDVNQEVLSFVSDPPGPYELGQTDVTLMVSDGMFTTECSAIVTVLDNTPPVMLTYPDPVLTMTRGNGSYQTITVPDLLESISDNCSMMSIEQVSIIEVESDEEEDADNGKDMNDGKTSDDMIISNDCYSVELRDERNRFGNGRVYTIYLSATDDQGNTGVVSAEVHATKAGIAAVKDETLYTVTSKFCNNGTKKAARAEADIEIGGISITNYPNPMHQYTVFEFNIPEGGDVSLELYDLSGRKLETIIKARIPEGKHSRQFETSHLSPGIYFYKFSFDNVLIATEKIIKVSK